MAEISHADLLAVQAAITSIVRGDNDRIASHITARIDELKQKQDLQNGRVNRHEGQLAAIDARLDEREKLAARGLFRSLTRKQKAVVWSMAVAASGSLMDGIRHAVLFVWALIAKGLATP
jgi:hypothetical protein